MKMKHEILQAFLVDVRDKGSARIDRRKLAWMLGRINLNAGAFLLLLEEWEQIGGERKRLRGFQWGDDYTLIAGDVANVTDWTA
jgi:hypothetical protein